MHINNMKTIWLLLLLISVPAVFQAQKTLTGLWTGILSNDSTTVRKDQSFEIALTQYKEKVYGYSRSTFIVNDTLYYILKRVKGTINGDVCEVKDDDIISYNFRGKIDKGVKVTTTFRMNKQDSSWRLMGNWSTNQTKRFYRISGKVDLEDEPDMDRSKILPHLEELNLAKDIPFYAEAKKAVARPATEAGTIATASKKPATLPNEVTSPSPQKSDESLVKASPPSKQVARKEEQPVITQQKPDESLANTNPPSKEVARKEEKPTVAQQKPAQPVQDIAITPAKENPKTQTELVNKPMPDRSTSTPVNDV
jgi:hypothetical protein